MRHNLERTRQTRAVNRDLPLITGNTRHHGCIRDVGYALQLINWRDAA